ncbi:MAG: hypothetical protein FWD23_07160 [Oscillospiraceae bacterium]|nr:hypothetical protein [Oscillospiraceae bacterium]
MKPKKLTTFEAACTVAGNGIGGGLMALPFLAQHAGWLGTILVLCFAYLVTVALHFMIADMLLTAKNGSGILSVFREFLFRGKLKTPLTAGFFVLLLITLLFNLSAYIAGGADIISELTGAPPAASMIALYLAAAIVPILGLKALGVSEKATVLVMIAAAGALFAVSFAKGSNALPAFPAGAKAVFALYGLAMFSFSALFSVPQAVEGLERRPQAIKAAIAAGVGINLGMSLAICFSALRASHTVTKVAIVGWSAALGAPVGLVGSLLVLGAMITSYWAISLALSDMVCEQLGANRQKWPVYMISTLPCLLLALFSGASFTSFIGVAGGAVAVIIALLLLPAYKNAHKLSGNGDERVMARPLGGALWLILFVGVCYILMAAGSMLAV